MLSVVEGSRRATQRRSQDHSGELVVEAAADGAADQIEDEGDHALGELQNDVADKPIADDDIGRAGGRIPSLHVADEVEAARGEQGIGFLDQPIALAGFLAVAEEADAGTLRMPNTLSM